eukprot:GHVR01137149.1.p1 GENE.GHVR01137149.1~~GHVR01137149.1.p1  ORF type:complete len:217 (+),score=52.13 GHVR01137149.1:32-682(+)
MKYLEGVVQSDQSVFMSISGIFLICSIIFKLMTIGINNTTDVLYTHILSLIASIGTVIYFYIGLTDTAITHHNILLGISLQYVVCVPLLILLVTLWSYSCVDSNGEYWVLRWFSISFYINMAIIISNIYLYSNITIWIAAIMAIILWGVGVFLLYKETILKCTVKIVAHVIGVVVSLCTLTHIIIGHIIIHTNTHAHTNTHTLENIKHTHTHTHTK